MHVKHAYTAGPNACKISSRRQRAVSHTDVQEHAPDAVHLAEAVTRSIMSDENFVSSPVPTGQPRESCSLRQRVGASHMCGCVCVYPAFEEAVTDARTTWGNSVVELFEIWFGRKRQRRGAGGGGGGGGRFPSHGILRSVVDTCDASRYTPSLHLRKSHGCWEAHNLNAEDHLIGPLIYTTGHTRQLKCARRFAPSNSTLNNFSCETTSSNAIRQQIEAILPDQHGNLVSLYCALLQDQCRLLHARVGLKDTHESRPYHIASRPPDSTSWSSSHFPMATTAMQCTSNCMLNAGNRRAICCHAGKDGCPSQPLWYCILSLTGEETACIGKRAVNLSSPCQLQLGICLERRDRRFGHTPLLFHFHFNRFLSLLGRRGPSSQSLARAEESKTAVTVRLRHIMEKDTAGRDSRRFFGDLWPVRVFIIPLLLRPFVSHVLAIIKTSEHDLPMWLHGHNDMMTIRSKPKLAGFSTALVIEVACVIIVGHAKTSASEAGT